MTGSVSHGARPSRAQQRAKFQGARRVPERTCGGGVPGQSASIRTRWVTGYRCARAGRAPLTACLALLIFSCSGCAIFGGYSSGPLASVTIWNQPQEKIEDATTAVFVMDGYQTVKTGPTQITFQRPGSTEDNVAYGSLFFKRNVTERVVVSIRPRSDGSTVVSCTASLVENPGDWVGEDSHKVGKNRKEPYEQLLNSVRARLL